MQKKTNNHEIDYLTIIATTATNGPCSSYQFFTHWRQPRRGCRGHIPPICGLGDVNGNRPIPPQYYYVLSDIAEQYCLASVRSASSRFRSAIRRHKFASARQADSRLTRLVPTNLELALTPLSLQPLNHFTPLPIGEQSIEIERVCVCVCLSAIIFLELHVRSSTNFSDVTYGRGS